MSGRARDTLDLRAMPRVCGAARNDVRHPDYVAAAHGHEDDAIPLGQRLPVELGERVDVRPWSGPARHSRAHRLRIEFGEAMHVGARRGADRYLSSVDVVGPSARRRTPAAPTG